ncbi:MAG: glycosyltransferase [Deltaproteobacteria bacterium]|nr:glycosyltransferase [Deltaproteobacteria bacterium]
MKVLHVIPALAPRYGGPSQAVKGMCQALARQGQEVTIYTTNIGNLDVPLDRPVSVDGIEVRYFRVQQPRFYSFSIPLANALKNEVKRFDLVHIHSVFTWPTTAAAFYCRKYKLPYIVRPCGILDPVPLKRAYQTGWLPVTFELKRRYLNRQFLQRKYLKRVLQKRSYIKKIIYLLLVEKRNLEGAAAVHFTSREEAVAVQPCGISVPRFIAPLGIDLRELQHHRSRGFRDQHPELNGKKIVLFLSRVDAEKGLDLRIPALGKLAAKREDFTFVLSGSGRAEYEEQIKGLLHKHGLANRTILTSFVEGRLKWSIFEEAEVFVLPSHHENFGIAVVEAMSVGRPVVITNRIAIHEEVSKARAGLVVSGDSEELGRAIAELLNSSSLRESMGKEGRRLVETKFSWDKVARELCGVYEDIVKRTRRSSAWVRQAP